MDDKNVAAKTIDVKTSNKWNKSNDVNQAIKKKSKVHDPMDYKLKMRSANAVKDENILWNQRNKHHRNQIKMNAAWGRVAAQLDTSFFTLLTKQSNYGKPVEIVVIR